MGLLKTAEKLMPIAGPVLGLAGQGINALVQGEMNKKARKWAEHMYKWQRYDALQDWHMQNEYNSPEQQMARLRAAGLNPNLIYGNMSDGPTVRSTDSKSWNPEAPQFDFGGAIGQYQSIKLQQSQMDTIAIQQELLKQEIKNKQAQEFGTWQNAYLSASRRTGVDIDNKYAESMKQWTLEGMRTSTGKDLETMETMRQSREYQQKDYDLRVKKFELDQLKAGMSMQEAAQRILNMRERAKGYAIERLQKQEQTYKTQMEIKKLNEERDVIKQKLINMSTEKDKTAEELRLLKSQPDWHDKRTVDMLEEFLGGITPKNGRKFFW